MTVLTGPSAAALYGFERGERRDRDHHQEERPAGPRFRSRNRRPSPRRSKCLSSAKYEQPAETTPAGGYWRPLRPITRRFFNLAANTQTNASISVGNEKNQTYLR
ncbi:MAG: hypothetical protein ACLRM8_02145 [Alistipes sp.]